MACALGGAALGATGLAGPPSSHLTAALLMIGKLTTIGRFINTKIIGSHKFPRQTPTWNEIVAFVMSN